MILAIDPGSEKSAWVFLFDKKIVAHGINENDAILNVVNNRGYDHLAIEMIASYGMPVGKEVFETCVWIGRFIQQAMPREAHLIYRKDEKMFLCGSMKAKDGNIRQALIDLLGKPGTKKNPGATYGIKADEWAALAVAVTLQGR